MLKFLLQRQAIYFLLTRNETLDHLVMGTHQQQSRQHVDVPTHDVLSSQCNIVTWVLRKHYNIITWVFSGQCNNITWVLISQGNIITWVLGAHGSDRYHAFPQLLFEKSIKSYNVGEKQWLSSLQWKTMVLVDSLKGFRITLTVIMITTLYEIMNKPTCFKTESPYQAFNALMKGINWFRAWEY